MTIALRTREELSNTLTHLGGVLFTLSTAWILLIRAYQTNWQTAMGVTIFLCGMLNMYSTSTVYHWILPGKKAKKVMRVLDHVGIYIMIACSYTPILLSVVGGWLGWTVFGVLWAMVIGGAVYKIAAIGKYPRLSLLIYLVMGWSGVFVAGPVWEGLSPWAMGCILAEGLFYTGGTYFYTKDKKIRYFHAVWHVFVLLGSLAHWAAVCFILYQ